MNEIPPFDTNLTLDAYQAQALQTDQNIGDSEMMPFDLLGIFGEVGTLLSALKKKIRDREAYVGYHHAILEEFGDVLWYFSSIASRANVTLSSIAVRAIPSLARPSETEKEHSISFQEVQSKESQGQGQLESFEFEVALIHLGAKTGALLGAHETENLLTNNSKLSYLAEIFAAVINAADIADISLNEAAIRNLRKTKSRWPQHKVATPRFDEGFDKFERFPDTFKIRLFERIVEDKEWAIQQCNGINIGSRLTDNKMESDYYRFHDVFHWAYAAILGWSPVMRGLFKLKRKSRPDIDRAEDGARAIAMEEGISTLIFQRAIQLNYFKDITSLDYSLLKLIPEFVQGYEVSRCALWEWEKAILEGFRIFRLLKDHGGGEIIVDFVNRSIEFQELSLTADQPIINTSLALCPDTGQPPFIK